MTISKLEEISTDIERMKSLLLEFREADRLHIIGEAMSQINAGKAKMSLAGCDEWDIRIEYRK